MYLPLGSTYGYHGLFDLLDIETKAQKVKTNLHFSHSLGYVEIELTTTPCNFQAPMLH